MLASSSWNTVGGVPLRREASVGAVVQGQPEVYPDAEERRPFDVALTRPRRQVTFIAPPQRFFPFFVELLGNPDPHRHRRRPNARRSARNATRDHGPTQRTSRLFLAASPSWFAATPAPSTDRRPEGSCDFRRFSKHRRSTLDRRGHPEQFFPRYYDQFRLRGNDHDAALRALATDLSVFRRLPATPYLLQRRPRLGPPIYDQAYSQLPISNGPGSDDGPLRHFNSV